MKKYIQVFVVIALVLTIIGLAKSNVVKAGIFQNFISSADESPSFIMRQTSKPSSISVTQSGIYNVGGICEIEIEYKLESGLKDDLDVNVPTTYSAELPFGYEGELYLPGCHVVHYKDDKIQREMNTEDGDWDVCFAERPGIDLTVYYYHDEPFSASPLWIELDTTHKEGFACAPAFYTGEYSVGSQDIETKTPAVAGGPSDSSLEGVGSVLAPSSKIIVTESGAYSVGGICTFRVIYHEEYQTNDVHVADSLDHDKDPIDDYDYTENEDFPENEGMLYYPGCHVLHYDKGEMTHWEKGVDQGDWEICFSALPGKEMTIYYYLGDLENQGSSWESLETTVENGEACAPAFFTGVYVPTGK